jgi:hypothetical protein
VRRRIGDALLFASGAVIVVLTLVATDHRVRERASFFVGDGGRPAGLAAVGARAGELVRMVAHFALGFGGNHSILTVFALVAAVLFAAVLLL